jgi:hypothetical protein
MSQKCYGLLKNGMPPFMEMVCSALYNLGKLPNRFMQPLYATAYGNGV